MDLVIFFVSFSFFYFVSSLFFFNRKFNELPNLPESRRYTSYLKEVIKKYNYKEEIKLVISKKIDDCAVIHKGVRYIVLSYGLVSKLSEGEIKSIICHEFGHHINKDLDFKKLKINLFISFLSGSITSLILVILWAFGGVSLNDYFLFFFFMLLVFGKVFCSRMTVDSSRSEVKADMFSIRENGSDNFISLIEKIIHDDLFHNGTYYTGPHLPKAARIALAKEANN